MVSIECFVVLFVVHISHEPHESEIRFACSPSMQGGLFFPCLVNLLAVASHWLVIPCAQGADMLLAATAKRAFAAIH